MILRTGPGGGKAWEKQRHPVGKRSRKVEMIAMGALSVLFLPAPIMHSYTNAFEVVRAEGYHLEDIGHHAVLPRDRERSWPCAHQRLDGGTNPCLFDALMISIRFGRGRWKRIRI